jgi:hypothetical protein
MSELHAQRRPRRSTNFWRVYMFSWAVLAGASLSYLTLFALSGTDHGIIPGMPTKSNQESNRADLDRAQLSAQVRSLNETVASLRSDLARIKNEKLEQTASSSPSRDSSAPDQYPQIAKNQTTTAQATTAQATTAQAREAQTWKEQGADIRGTETRVTQSPSVVAGGPVLSEQIGSNPTFANQSEPTSNVTTSSLPGLNPGQAENQQVVASTPINTINAQPTATTTIPPLTTSPRQDTTPAQTAAAPPATVAARRPRGPNLATSPLRSGKLPPLPRMSGRPTAAASPPQSNTLTGAAQPAYRNSIAQPSSPIRTSSIPAPAQPAAQSFGTPAAFPTQPPVTSFGNTRVNPSKSVTPAALSLSTATSITGLRASWLLLTTTHRDAFIGYSPRYVANPTTGAYQLLAGPIASHADADRVCTELRTQNINCGVTDYVGNPL